MYLYYLGQTLAALWGGALIAVLIVLGFGFVGSWMWDGRIYDENGVKRLDWDMKTRWLRLFYRFTAPPALLFGIPAVIAWFHS